MLYFQKSEFKEVLRKLGVRPGDRLFVHSNAACLGKIERVEEVFAAFLEVLDYRGILLMPTYSAAGWPRAQYFNPKTTKAETGNLPNLFMNYPGVHRTIQGNHSVAVWGDAESLVTRDWVASSFSRDSSIYLTVENGFKNVMLGTSFSSGCSIFHCVEEELQVPYRFRKSFPGVVEWDGQKRTFDFTMYVRDLAYTVDVGRAASFLESSNFVRSMRYHYGNVVVFPLPEAYETVRKELRRDPFLLVAKVQN